MWIVNWVFNAVHTEPSVHFLISIFSSPSAGALMMMKWSRVIANVCVYILCDHYRMLQLKERLSATFKHSGATRIRRMHILLRKSTNTPQNREWGRARERDIAIKSHTQSANTQTHIFTVRNHCMNLCKAFQYQHHSQAATATTIFIIWNNAQAISKLKVCSNWMRRRTKGKKWEERKKKVHVERHTMAERILNE